jgi:hypothetical protein
MPIATTVLTDFLDAVDEITDIMLGNGPGAEKAYHRRSRYSPGLPTMYAHQRQLASKLRELSRATRQRIEPRPSFAELTKPPSKPKPARTQDPQDADTDEIKQQDPPQLDAWPRRPGV